MLLGRWAVIFASWNHAFHARNQDYKKSHLGIKPKHMITNMLKKSNIKHSTYKNNYYLKSTKWKYIRYFYEMYSDAVICLQAEDERTTYNNY